MAAKTLAQKFLIKAGQQGLILNAPATYVEKLEPLPEAVEITTTSGDSQFDFVQLFIAKMADLHELFPTATRALKPGGLLWVAYPKGSKAAGIDVNRDSLHAATEEYHFTGVTLIAIDETWSAMRFKPAE